MALPDLPPSLGGECQVSDGSPDRPSSSEGSPTGESVAPDSASWLGPSGTSSAGADSVMAPTSSAAGASSGVASSAFFCAARLPNVTSSISTRVYIWRCPCRLAYPVLDRYLNTLTFSP